MNESIYKVETELELKECFPILQELRPHLKFEEFLDIYKQSQKHDGYEIICIRKNNEVVALMGYRILYDFVRGRHLYIDDLVTTEKVRSTGLGAKLLKYAEELAPKLGCKVLRLCTGIENEKGIKFYEKNNWTKRAYAYTKKII